MNIFSPNLFINTFQKKKYTEISSKEKIYAEEMKT